VSARITISYIVPSGYEPGDYAVLFGNGGSGSIDYDTPLSAELWPFFPGGSGLYGFGHAPFGRFRFGHCWAMRTAGFGHLPWGRFPFGHGAVRIKAVDIVDECGDYKYALVAYDAAGNESADSPEEVTVTIHIAPAAPTGLIKTSYNRTTGDLILAA